MDKELAKKYEKKITENLEKEGFEQVDNVTQYKRESFGGEEVYSIGDLYIEIVSNSQIGWAHMILDLEYDEYEFESKLYNEEDNSEDRLQKLFRDIDDLKSFISDFWYYDYIIIPEKDILEKGE